MPTVMWYDKLTTFIIPSSNSKQPHTCNKALKTNQLGTNQ